MLAARPTRASKAPRWEKAKGLLNTHAGRVEAEPMTTTTRRSFIQMAIALGATAAWGQPLALCYRCFVLLAQARFKIAKAPTFSCEQ